MIKKSLERNESLARTISAISFPFRFAIVGGLEKQLALQFVQVFGVANGSKLPKCFITPNYGELTGFPTGD